MRPRRERTDEYKSAEEMDARDLWSRTGEPKGVVVEHRHACAHARAKAADEAVGARARVFVASRPTFDLCEGDVLFIPALWFGTPTHPLTESLARRSPGGATKAGGGAGDGGGAERTRVQQQRAMGLGQTFAARAASTGGTIRRADRISLANARARARARGAVRRPGPPTRRGFPAAPAR